MDYTELFTQAIAKGAVSLCGGAAQNQCAFRYALRRLGRLGGQPLVPPVPGDAGCFTMQEIR